jgi:hypothetical protein
LTNYTGCGIIISMNRKIYIPAALLILIVVGCNKTERPADTVTAIPSTEIKSIPTPSVALAPVPPVQEQLQPGPVTVQPVNVSAPVQAKAPVQPVAVQQPVNNKMDSILPPLRLMALPAEQETPEEAALFGLDTTGTNLADAERRRNTPAW